MARALQSTDAMRDSSQARRSLRLLVTGFVLLLALLAGGASAWLLERPYSRVFSEWEAHAASAPRTAPARASSFAPPLAAPGPAAPVPAPSASTVPSVSAVPSAASAPFVLERTRNFLLLGVDRRGDGKGAGLVDSIVVVALEPNRGAGFVSVPRDLWVTIPDYGEERINTILALAARSKRDGLELFRRVVSDTLALPIEHAIALDLGVFERLVDAVSGVDVDVPCPIIDSFVDLRVPEGRRALSIEAGRVRMDGVTAGMYVRSRHGRSDFSRARRQQAVLLGIRERLVEADSITMLATLVRDFEASIHTDLSRLQLMNLARAGLAVDRARLHGIVLAPPLTRAERTPEGKAVLIADPAAIRAALSELFSAPAPGSPLRAECPRADVALHD